LFTWSFGADDDVGNLGVTAPTAVTEGQHEELPVRWTALPGGLRYLGGISHTTPTGLYSLTVVNVLAP
jgi:hypothetical protein